MFSSSVHHIESYSHGYAFSTIKFKSTGFAKGKSAAIVANFRNAYTYVYIHSIIRFK